MRSFRHILCVLFVSCLQIFFSSGAPAAALVPQRRSLVDAGDGVHLDVPRPRSETSKPTTTTRQSLRNPTKRQATLSNPTITLTAGVDGFDGGGGSGSSSGGGGLTTDQKISIGVGVPSAVGAVVGMWFAWKRYRRGEGAKPTVEVQNDKAVRNPASIGNSSSERLQAPTYSRSTGTSGRF
ncbi:hypothetical protein QBC47DRAFT_384748 [Echria macrotheca]|uniref:Transmembrane protein n=1 Tax=Echria macrotheca TaxID=438768 RepID=A0AAJ0BAZ5_9PEZI|nr:hypothetical protein QBC47DRAFT_384748 [Echria macrotheca]